MLLFSVTLVVNCCFAWLVRRMVLGLIFLLEII